MSGQKSRTIKELTAQRDHPEAYAEVPGHLDDFAAACNFGHRWKTLGDLTPYEFLCKPGTVEPNRSIRIPVHEMPGLDTSAFQNLGRTYPRASTPPDPWLPP